MSKLLRKGIRKLIDWAYEYNVPCLDHTNHLPEVKIFNRGFFDPVIATSGSLCYDIFADIDSEDVKEYLSDNKQYIIIKPRETVKIPTGLFFELPSGYDIFIYDRSGNATKLGLKLVNRVAVIDSDYRGEVFVCMRNDSDEDIYIWEYTKIAQMDIRERSKKVTLEFVSARQDIAQSDRGDGGFGSTDIIPHEEFDDGDYNGALYYHAPYGGSEPFSSCIGQIELDRDYSDAIENRPTCDYVLDESTETNFVHEWFNENKNMIICKMFLQSIDSDIDKALDYLAGLNIDSTEDTEKVLDSVMEHYEFLMSDLAIASIVSNINEYAETRTAQL